MLCVKFYEILRFRSVYFSNDLSVKGKWKRKGEYHDRGKWVMREITLKVNVLGFWVFFKIMK